MPASSGPPWVTSPAAWSWSRGCTGTGRWGSPASRFSACRWIPRWWPWRPASRPPAGPGWPKRSRFCANVLSADQEALARTFANTGADKFAGVGWSPAPNGPPRLHGALAWVDCEIETVHEAGDHYLVVARVVGLETGTGRPLLFYRGGFGAFES